MHISEESGSEEENAPEQEEKENAPEHEEVAENETNNKEEPSD